MYRGQSFAGFFDRFMAVSSRSILVTEYGVDSYDDSDCSRGWDSVCADGTFVSADGIARGEATQAEWDASLTSDWMAHSAARGAGAVIGGCVMEWSDEAWKNGDANVKGCRPNIDAGGAAPPPPSAWNFDGCEAKAHRNCPRALSDGGRAVCGYPLASSYDGYSNEAWFGIVTVTSAPGSIDVVRPRPVYQRLKVLSRFTSRHPVTPVTHSSLHRVS